MLIQYPTETRLFFIYFLIANKTGKIDKSN